MQDLLKDQEALDKWKEEELAKCEAQKQAAIEMYGKLSAEMEEMKQIASPGVAMDISTGKVVSSEAASKSSFLSQSASVQTVISAAGTGPHIQGSTRVIQHTYRKHNATQDFQSLQLLIKDTQSVAKTFLNCMARQPTSMLEVAAIQDPDYTDLGAGFCHLKETKTLKSGRKTNMPNHMHLGAHMKNR